MLTMGERYTGRTGCVDSTPWAMRSEGPSAWCRSWPTTCWTTRESTGVADPGDLGDGDWEGRLRALVEAINASDLHVVGRMLTREELLRGLRNALLDGRPLAPRPVDRRRADRGAHRGHRPGRLGTTILFELLGLDPGLQTPIATDVLHPVPPAGTTADAVTAMTEAEQELWADVQPEFATMHNCGPTCRWSASP